MSPLVVLTVLLVAAYLGTFLFGGRLIRGRGLASGAEFLVLGFLAGPEMLGLVGPELLAAFRPLTLVAIGWVALEVGLEYGFVGQRRIPLGHLALGILGGLATAALVAAALGGLLHWLDPAAGPFLRSREHLLLAAGAGIALAETTRHVVRWAVERHGAAGPLTGVLLGVTDADDLVPLVGAGLLFALFPAGPAPWVQGPGGWLGVTAVLGAVLGVVGAVLLGRDFRSNTLWGVLFGTSLMAVGMAARLDLAAVAVAFAMGLALTLTSRHRARIREAAASIERPVLLPTLLIAGASIDLSSHPGLPLLAAAAIGARLTGKWLEGLALLAGSPATRRAGPLLGLGLASSGAVSVTVGLAFALRFPGPIGSTILALAAAAAVAGEFIGPAALRASLRRAGELPEPAPAEAEAAATRP